MTLTIKNADSSLFDAIEKIIKLSSKPYELTSTNEQSYANEVEKIISQVESGEMKTRTMQESKAYINSQINKIKSQHANY